MDRLSPGKVADVLRRRWYVILICALLTPAVTYLVAKGQPKEYAATSKLLFRERAILPSPGTGTAAASPDRAAATNRDLVVLPAVAARAAATLGGGFTADKVAARISTNATPESDVFSITAGGRDPDETARLANAYASAFVAERAATRRAALGQAQGALRRQISGLRNGPGAGVPASLADRTRLADLQSRDLEISVARSLEDGGAQVVQRAKAPTKAESPRPQIDAAIGLGLGLVLGLLLALALEALDTRLRSLTATASAFNRPVLGAIPRSRALRRQTRSGRQGLPPGEVEAFRMLRANLRYFNDDRQVNAVLVTSASLAEGKSTVAWNLAAAGADAGGRVLLIEADMRRPVLAKRFGVEADQGLSDVLSTDLEPVSAMRQVVLEPFTGNGSAARMDVIFAGPPIANPVDPIESSRMTALMGEARAKYDLVVVDTPPMSVVPDAIPLIRHVDGVILVSRVGRTTRDAAEHVQKQLDNLGAPTLGVVVNGIGRNEGHYGYAYDASTRRRPAADGPQAA